MRQYKTVEHQENFRKHVLNPFPNLKVQYMRLLNKSWFVSHGRVWMHMYTPPDSSISLVYFLSSKMCFSFSFGNWFFPCNILFVFRHRIFTQKTEKLHTNPGRRGRPACRLPRKPSRHMSVAQGEMESQCLSEKIVLVCCQI